MNNSTYIPFILANIVSADNNYNYESCKKNLELLNKLWDVISEEEQEKYCENFNKIKEILNTEIKLWEV